MSDTLEVKVPSHFERPGHRDAVAAGIVRGALPLKFAYAGSAAHTHDRLAHQEGYRSVTGAVSFVREAMRRAGLDEVPALAEIGPGNGVSSLALLARLHDAEKPPTTFLGLDFSESLLAMARKRFESRRPDVSFAQAGWDVEAEPTAAIGEWRTGEAPITALFLGNTIGNFERPGAALRNIQRSLRIGDTLVVGATLRTGNADPEGMLTPYRNQVFRAAALEPLIAIGIDSADLDFELSYEKDEVVGHAILTRPLFLDDHELPPGHRVRCFVSRRYLPSEINDLVSCAGLRPFVSSVDESSDHLVVIAFKDEDDQAAAPALS
ncbi:L-histidine N(alpha)-methyltransferase [Actinoplanes subtropicus]|uniref:L-histidine N(alpha)-methyltransferase n=1 Tax=Actinoplanes subtropicus TaxID=543632 RepID=UPI000A9E6056|nr:L-histidine N(alpha)-methyltransferase [Actinoplanes subtropicus]